VACSDPDFLFPLKADVFYSKISQGDFNEIKKEWIYDGVICLNASPFSRRGRQDSPAELLIQNSSLLIGRTKTDVRYTSLEDSVPLTHILITNLRLNSGELVYKETAGVRSGKGTIFEIATYEPALGPFQSVEYYKMLLRRTESQTVAD